MTSQILAKRYAKALMTLGQEDGNQEQYGEELSQFVAFWGREPEFADAVSNPLYAKDSRKVICSAVLEKMGLSPAFKSLLELMLDQKRGEPVAEMDHPADLAPPVHPVRPTQEQRHADASLED